MHTIMPIAPLTAAHAMAYKALMLHAYEHAADSFTSTPQERALEPDSWWRGRIDDPSGLTWVWGAFAEAELVGTVSVEYAAKTKTRHKGLIVAMFVREHFRGQGLARKLMRAAVEHGMARQGLRVLQLEVTQGNTHAERLYQSLGFEPFGVEPMAVWTPDGYRSKVHMWLDLASMGARKNQPS
ncbi:GNAT family N-acetyltransferase [Limnohabitans sp.]|uniref:GNAT family N-acetyltransferase n=1 Tax=Limnohabitans sp. TaxID=1907725 RepID=UPI0025BF8C6E|nr:GNAT family N-acetyltransferase [Limnohabitans sp.]